MSDGTEDAALPRAAPAGRVPTIAIVGRPNAGKSTLFNRLAKTRRALVDARPGVTRDRNVAPARWGDRAFLVVDTGGFEDAEASGLAASVRQQAALAAEEADAVIVLLDGREGVNPGDRDLMHWLRRLDKPVAFAVNKLDTPARDDEAVEFFAFGLDAVFPVSAAHGRGVDDLMAHLLAQLPAEDEPQAAAAEDTPVTLAIVGRPNAGKSSLLNRIVGYQRAIVHATPGTTRDTLDTPFRHGDRAYVLVDTAGIRRRPRVHDQLERASVLRALQALERAEVAVLVIDATAGMTDQDARIAGYALERGRALLFVLNKWDAVPRALRDRTRAVQAIRDQYPTLADVPVVCLSALTGRRVTDLFPALERLIAAHRRRVRTPDVNRVLADAVQAQAPPSTRGRRPRFLYAAQTGMAPPTFTVFCSAPDLVVASYERYLANVFRTAFELQGTPLRIRFRARTHERT